jgi:gliding motility-associated-like protein
LKQFKKFISIFILFILVSPAKSSHLVGGFITYRFLGNNGTNSQYRVTILAYRDCAKDGTLDEILFDDDIKLCVYRGNKRLYSDYTVKLLSRKKVDPVGNTNCPEIASACLEQGIYETTITLPNSTTNYHLKWERCCRNTQNNLQDQFGMAYQGQTYYATIPPSSLQNSSPYFLEVPVPFICRNDTTTLRNRAIDPDGDSLSFKFVTPWQGADDKTPQILTCADPMTSFLDVDYRNGFSATKPFGNSGLASIDAYNGLTTFMSPTAGRFAVAIEVTEWRNGMAISTIRLDLQILVINCSPNNKPALKYQKGSRFWSLEPGEVFCTEVTGFDSKDTNQIITLRAFGDIISGSANYTGTKASLQPATNANKKSVTSTFCWTPDCNINYLDTYRVIFEAFDNGCPGKFVNENVLISIKPFKPLESVSGPKSSCQQKTGLTYSVNNRNWLNKLKWRITNGTIVGSDTGNSVTVNWGIADTGYLVLDVTSRWGCPSPSKVFKVVLLKSPDKPQMSGLDSVCINQKVYNYRVSPITGITSNWRVLGGTIQGGVNQGRAIDVVWDFTNYSPGMVIVYDVNEGGCSSPEDTIIVHGVPVIKPKIIGPTSVCPNNDNIIYEIENREWKATYTWSAAGARMETSNVNGIVSIDWGSLGLGKVIVQSTSRYGCTDTSELLVVKSHNLIGQPPIGDSILCELTTGVPYNVRPVSGETYAWTIAGGTIASGQATDKITTIWGTAGNAWVGVQATAYDSIAKMPCLSKVYKLNIVLHPIPSGNLFPQKPLPEQCESAGNWFDAVTWTLAIKDSVEVQITGANYRIIKQAVSASQETKTLQISLNTPGTFNIRARVISQYGCVGPYDNSSLTINPKPKNTKLAGDSVICSPVKQNSTYNASGVTGSSYDWNIQGGQFVIPPANGNSAQVEWDTLAPKRRLRVFEVSDKMCPGDSLVWNVFFDKPFLTSKWVTVTPPPLLDGQILVHYQLLNAPRNTQAIQIQRKPFGFANFWNVGSSNAVDSLFTDFSAKPDQMAYDYRAYVLNLCGDTIFSNINTSVWLTGSKVGPLKMAFTFTPYLGWSNGVERYELYRELANGGGYVLYQTYGNALTDSIENGADGYTQRFRIKAYERNGYRISWSNDIELNYDPIMFVPNAFTPDGKGLNEVFKPSISGMKEYKMVIYNRWGQKLFETKDANQGWDGTVSGDPAHDGVYVYTIEFTDYRDKIYQFSGTIHLLR